MKKVKIKLTKDEARIMAENLGDMIQKVPVRATYPLDTDGDWWYATDRLITGVVSMIWQKSLTRLLTCEQSGMVMILPEPHAVAYKLKLADLRNQYRSDAHELLAMQTYQLIDQAI